MVDDFRKNVYMIKPTLEVQSLFHQAANQRWPQRFTAWWPGGSWGGATSCHSTPGQTMASRGVLINNSMVQATVERAAEDVSQVAFLHWAQCQPTTETADSLGVEEGVSDREAAVCLLPLPHHWLHYRSRLYTSTTSVSNNHFTVILLFIHGICSWPKHENE